MKRGETDSNSSGVTAVVLGVLGLAFILNFAFQAVILGLILGITGILFAYSQARMSPNSWSKAGKILNAILIILCAVLLIFVVIALVKNPSAISQLTQAG